MSLSASLCRLSHLPMLALLFGSLAIPSASAATPPTKGAVPADQVLQIVLNEKGFGLVVPAGRLVLVLPKGGFVDGRSKAPDNHPRYFYFTDDKQSIIVSGWFEPARAYKGAKAHWNEDTATWRKQGLPTPEAVSFEKIGKWDAVLYDQTLLPKMGNTHIRAHCVEAGSWIDIHLSTTSPRPLAESRVLLRQVIEGIVVKELDLPSGGKAP